MRTKFVVCGLMLMLLAGMVGCGTEAPVDSAPAGSDSAEIQSDDTEPTEPLVEETDATASTVPASTPDGEIVDGKLATKENPVPLGTWASVTISEGGWPLPAFVRISDVSTDQVLVKKVIDAYDNEHPNSKVTPLEEHAEFLEYVLVEYEAYFPDNFSESDSFNYWGLVLTRENNNNDWIASNGSNYFWMGEMTKVEEPLSNSKNGETVKCKTVYPMIKGYTDYTLSYKERTADLSETITTYFAVK